MGRAAPSCAPPPRPRRLRLRAGLPGVLALALLAACATPRSGPTPEEISAPPPPGGMHFALVPVDDAVAAAAAPPRLDGFPPEFLAADPIAAERLAPGDRLRLKVWENVDEGVYSWGKGPRAQPFETRVDGEGRIRVPYVGALRAEGRTPDQLRAALESRLSGLTADPQVEILRDAPPPEAPPEGDRAVLVLGEAARGGVRAISRDTARLTGLLAAALGPVQDPGTLQITLRRAGRAGKVWLRSIYDDPALDVALRPGDAVIVDRDRRAFTGLGAVGTSRRAPFPSPRLDALEALGILGGLNPTAGDPTGIFVFRTEDAGTAAAVAAAIGAPPPPDGAPVRTAYLIDLTAPGGMFAAAAFEIRDGDVVYATDAPSVRWLKILNALAPLVNFAGSARSLSGG